MTPEQQVDLDCRRVSLPAAAIYYPADRPISAELADHIRRAWMEAASTGNAIVLPDNWRVEVIR